MANIQHSTIADADRHEPKGASTAIAKKVLMSNGDGSTTFNFVTYADLLVKPVAFGYEQVLFGSSTAASQQPSATNTALQVEFGAAQTTTDCDLSSAGLLTFNITGQYEVTLYFRFGRTSSAGEAILFNRININGSQLLNSNSISLTDSITTIPFSATIVINATAGDTFSTDIMRDSAGINNGGLFQTVPSAAGWNISPSATIVVSKFVGLQ